MDFGSGSSNGLGINQEGSFSCGEVRHPRHSTSQVQHLEAYFTECPNPDKNQRNQLSVILGLDSDQIKIWFQNKRSQTRTEHGIADSAALRSDNERLSCENLAIQEALKNTACPSCGREICNKEKSEEQRQSNLDCLKLEHAFLNEQIRSLTNKASIAPGPSTIGISDQEKSVMAETAAGAMQELVELLKINESLWIKIPTNKASIAPGPSLCWKLPSGCMIEDMPGGFSKLSINILVTWVEHVEVLDDSTQTHQLYKDLVSSGAAYGAERWIATLQRMCERFTYSGKQSTSSVDEFGRACTSLEGKRGMKNLAHRMVKSFCARLTMPGKTDFPLPRGSGNSGVQVSVRENTESGQPNGMIVMAAASLRLPLSALDVFNFFTDQRTRFQWETLYNDTPMYETTRIANGIHPGNSITILESHVRKENQVLQETSIDELGGLVVYAPIHISAIDLALSGTSTSTIPILPSGIIISSDGRSDSSSRYASSDPNRSSSLVTVAFQMLVGDNWCSDQAGQDSVSEITTKISSTIQGIKVALGCCHLD